MWSATWGNTRKCDEKTIGVSFYDTLVPLHRLNGSVIE